MGLIGNVVYYSFHPNQLRSILQWKVWHNAPHERDESKDTETQKICFKFLDQTSRSFSAVIKELHPELLLPICVFYLVLRGLDTVEDDTSIPLAVKEPLLRNFKDRLTEDGWTFDGNRPEEKDRELLVQFHNIITEFKNMKPAYQAIIKDITDKMGNGMADYCIKAESEKDASVKTVAEYDEYCWYVAGLVGEGLTRLFVEAEFGNPALLKRPRLFKSMGLFLQKTNIIRDIREDFDDKRRFWPKEIWSKHVDSFEDLFKPEHREAALNCNSEMILNALEHVEECLFYLAGLREQSVFNFCAIPQAMAIATLELCFRNYAIFEKNIKITKGDACELMVQSTQNLHVLCQTFRRLTRRIHKKNTPKPNLLKISIVCGKIEKFIESIFPTQTAEDAQRRVTGELSAQEQKKRDEDAENRSDVYFLMALMGCIVIFIAASMMLAAWFMGARFDLAWQEIKSGNLRPPAKPSSIVHPDL